MFWFNADHTRGAQFLFAKDAAGPGNHLKIGMDGANLEIRAQNGTDDHYLVADADILADVWYHLTLSFGPDGMKLYLNGILVGESEFAIRMQDNREPIVIGGSNHLNTDQSGDLSRLRIDDAFSGRIDELMLYGRELDSLQVAWLRDNGATTSEESGGMIPASESIAEDWVWDVEVPEEDAEGEGNIVVSARDYVPVPGVPDWMMDATEWSIDEDIPHDDGDNDAYVAEFLAGTLLGLGLQRSRPPATGHSDRSLTDDLTG